MPLYLMILTSYFAIEPKSIRGGIGYRYVGLYGSLVKALMNHSPRSKVFWYSHTDRYLRTISELGCRKARVSIIKAVLNAISDTYRNKSYLAVVVAFPYAVPKIRNIFEYFFCLLVLKIFSVKRVRVIVDDFDPPAEAAYAFSEAQPSILKIIGFRILEMLTLKLASFIITVTESFRHHIARIYQIKKEKISVVPNGTLVKFISYVPPRTQGNLTILYSGSAMKIKHVDKLILAIKRVRERGLEVSCVLTGQKLMNIPYLEAIVHKTIDDWRSYVKSCLELSDVCVIPYPRRLFWDYAIPTKLLEYMAAGKPIISTNLKEIGKIIRMFNCGLVARDWKEFELHLERLYHDRKLAKELGENGRRAAEKYFNYELLAEALLSKLVNQCARMYT